MAIASMYECYTAGDDVTIVLVTDSDCTDYTAEAGLHTPDGEHAATFTADVQEPSTISLMLDSQDTAPLLGEYELTIKIVSPGGRKTTVVAGLVEFLGDSS
jgi:hypothetical protein